MRRLAIALVVLLASECAVAISSGPHRGSRSSHSSRANSHSSRPNRSHAYHSYSPHRAYASHTRSYPHRVSSASHRASTRSRVYRPRSATHTYRRHSRIRRSAQARDSFKRAHPCPSTGRRSGSCPGYVIDHIRPLECGGADAPSNMQWQTVGAGKAKDKTERYCR
jgi:hypothetical protein